MLPKVEEGGQKLLQVAPLGSIWPPLPVLGSTWLHMATLGHTWSHLAPLGPILTHLRTDGRMNFYWYIIEISIEF